jgi:DNA-binding NtrC family response regulator
VTLTAADLRVLSGTQKATLTALVVSPDARRLAAYQSALSSMVGRILAAPDFPSARRILCEAAPALLVADVRLKEYNGLHLALWGRESNPLIQAILMGEPDTVLEREASLLGAWILPLGDLHALREVVVDALSGLKAL